MSGRYLFFLLLFFTPIFLKAQKPAYILYNKQGKKAKYKTVVNAMKEHDVVLFGELHDNPIAHWLQLETLKDVSGSKDLILGGEFFESDVQLIIDEYLSGKIPLSHLEREGRVWPNFSTDYKPLLQYSYENKIPFIATNIPRRYAGYVARKGKDSLEFLSQPAKTYMVPLPFSYDENLKSYKQMKDMGAHGHGMSYMADAQAVKDATMAYFILKNLQPGKLFFHINGAYHSDYYEGIYWFLMQERSDMKILTVTTVESQDLIKPDESIFDKADYIIVVPPSMTSTH